MFALAANGFNKPSETFIRAHAHGIAPGNTLLIAERRERKVPIRAPLILFSKRLPILIGPDAGMFGVLAGALAPARLFASRSAYLARLLRQCRVDTMMVEYGSCAVHLTEAAQRAHCRFFVHFHGVDASKALRDPEIVTRYKAMFAMADGIFAPSAFIAKKLEDIGCPARKLHVVPCGVDITKIEPATPTGNHLLAVGRFTEKKAPLATLRAFAQVKKAIPDATLTMLGDGPLLDQTKAEVAALGLTDSVILPGMVSAADVHVAMQRTRVFMQHSVTAANGDVEGLPVAILEAMAAGLPVVSTLHSGIPEAVIDGQTGYLVAEHDVDGMAAKVTALLQAPDHAQTLGAAGRTRVSEGFTHAATIKKLQTIMGLATD